MATVRDWMSRINGDLRVSSVIMPGSHDAGVAKTNVELNLGIKKEWAVCQTGEISEQAACGSRFFDCRVFYQAQSPDVTNAHIGASLQRKLNRNAFQTNEDMDAFTNLGIINKKMRFGHFSGERKDDSGHGGVGGAYGGVLKAAIQQAIGFVHANPSEFIILRFSHSGWPAKLVEVMKYWYSKYDDPLTKHWRNYIYATSSNIASAFVRDLRGKVVMIFDGKHTSLDPAVGLHRFSKWEDTNSAPADGLTTCGKYAASPKTKVVVKEALEAAAGHFYHAADHLHFVYYQQTLTLKSIEAKTTAVNKSETFGKREIPYSGGVRSNLGNFLDELRALAGKTPNTPVWRFVNVISHDFVDAMTCRQIIELNENFQW